MFGVNKKRWTAGLLAVMLLQPGMVSAAATRDITQTVTAVTYKTAVSAPISEKMQSGLSLPASAMPRRAAESKRMILTAPSEAAELYAYGLQQRNASIQYAVFSKAFKKQMYPRFVELNWNTGGSSPWITGWKVEKEVAAGSGTKLLELKLTTATSGGPETPVLLTLRLVLEHGSWAVDGAATDRELPRSCLPVKPHGVLLRHGSAQPGEAAS